MRWLVGLQVAADIVGLYYAAKIMYYLQAVKYLLAGGCQ